MESVTFTFTCEDDVKHLDTVKQHGHEIKSLTIVLDQKETRNRENACEVLNILTSLTTQNVSSLTLKFIGENPLFFSGQEFVKALKSFFQSKNQNGDTGRLLEVDVGDLFVDFDKDFLESLSTNHRNLQALNIQNQIIISKVHPAYIVDLLDKCKRLKRLSVFYINLSDEVLEKLTEDNRAPFERLSIKCRHQDNYSNILSRDSWKRLSEKHPNLKVKVILDPAFSPEKISKVLCSEIPVSDLKLETNFDSLDLETISEYYSNSLERLVFPAQPSQQLTQSLINMATKCQKLRSLHLYCKVSDETKKQILELCPKLAESNDYDF